RFDRRRRWCAYDRDWFSGRWRASRLRRWSKFGGEMAFEKFCGDFIQRTGGNPRGGNAQFLGLGKDFLAFDSKFLCYIVNTNGHNFCLPLSLKRSYANHAHNGLYQTHNGEATDVSPLPPT